MVKSFKEFLKDESADVGLVFKVIVGVVVGVAVLGLLLSMLNIVSFGTNEFTVEFTSVTPSPGTGGGINPNGGCLSVGSTGKKLFTIAGSVKNTRGGFVEGAQVEISGVGAQDLAVTKGGTDAGKFTIKADYNLGGTPFGTSTISFKKDGFVRKDITIAVKTGNC